MYEYINPYGLDVAGGGRSLKLRPDGFMLMEEASEPSVKGGKLNVGSRWHHA